MLIYLFAICLIGIAFLGLGLNIFFRKGASFPETEIGKNKVMRRMGITCVKCDERVKWKQEQTAKKVVRLPPELGIDLRQFQSRV
jgi:ribosomal protein L36